MKNNAFVPFAVSHSTPTPPSVAPPVGSGTPAFGIGRPFRPLTLGAAAPSAAPHPSGEPKVTLERDGDRVSRIRIECSCGETIDLDCAY